MTDPHSAATIAAQFLQAFFSRLGRELATDFEHSTQQPEDAADALAEWLDEYNILLQSQSDGLPGNVMLLISPHAANQLATGDPGAGATLNAEARAALETLARGAYTHGCRAIGATDCADFSLTETSADGAPALLAALGGSATGVMLRVETQEGAVGEMVLLLDDRIMQKAPEEDPAPTLTPEEVQDILAGFEPVLQAPHFSHPPPAAQTTAPENIDMVLDIRLVATARLGRVEMPIGQILGLGPGSVIEVGHLVDEPVDLLINDKLIARGDVVVVDEKFGLRITEIISQRERIESLR